MSDSDEKEWQTTLYKLANKFDAEYHRSQYKKRKFKKQNTSEPANIPLTEKDKNNEYQRKMYKIRTENKKQNIVNPAKKTYTKKTYTKKILTQTEIDKDKAYQREKYMERKNKKSIKNVNSSTNMVLDVGGYRKRKTKQNKTKQNKTK
jgi:hypothetical protein